MCAKRGFGHDWVPWRLHFSLGSWTAGKAWFRAWRGSVAAPFSGLEVGFQANRSISGSEIGLRAKRGFGHDWALRRLHSLGSWTAGKAWFRAWPGSVAAPFFSGLETGLQASNSISGSESGLRAKDGSGHDWAPWRLHFRFGNWVPGKQLHFSIGNWTAGKACFRAWLGCVAAPFQFWRLGKWDPGRQRTKNATDPIARGRCPIARATCGKPA